jgi:hypothetical protein
VSLLPSDRGNEHLSEFFPAFTKRISQFQQLLRLSFTYSRQIRKQVPHRLRADIQIRAQ